ncbi:DUF1569 domain-containing protein [uncultured Croceitalea sp.]|uniref:DUF1569 domain-containing protein n=1 Tax=uncultured Croceitalea sp. TaxID=1798908 RepID=UPI0033062A8B
MNLSEEQIRRFQSRIDKLYHSKKPLFGKLNANQMLCQCIEFFTLANPIEKRGMPVRIPCGETPLLRQNKTDLIDKDFEEAQKILKRQLKEFASLPEDFDFGEHPYFGKIKREFWVQLAVYHLNHHLKLFDI